MKLPRLFPVLKMTQPASLCCYAQVVDFVKAHTGARMVMVFDHTTRKRMAADLKVQIEVQRPAVLLVHSDYTVNSGPQRVREVMGEQAEALLQRRVAFYNVWKALARRVEELPLAMCDAQTDQPDDMLRMDLKYRERTGEIYVMRHSPKHRWMYFPKMEPNTVRLTPFALRYRRASPGFDTSARTDFVRKRTVLRWNPTMRRY